MFILSMRVLNGSQFSPETFLKSLQTQTLQFSVLLQISGSFKSWYGLQCTIMGMISSLACDYG